MRWTIRLQNHWGAFHTTHPGPYSQTSSAVGALTHQERSVSVDCDHELLPSQALLSLFVFVNKDGILAHVKSHFPATGWPGFTNWPTKLNRLGFLYIPHLAPTVYPWATDKWLKGSHPLSLSNCWQFRLQNVSGLCSRAVVAISLNPTASTLFVNLGLNRLASKIVVKS